MFGWSNRIFHCPFYGWDDKLLVHGECGNIKFPDSKARCEYEGSYCGDINGWKRCTVARNLLLYYERTECDDPPEGGDNTGAQRLQSR